LAILDPQGGIREVNAALAVWLEQEPVEVIGKSIASILTERCPTWGQAWSQLDGSAQTFSHEQWEIPAADGEPLQRFRAELTRAPGVLLFRLNSILPPCLDLPAEGCEKCLSAAPARRDMFFRLIRAEEQLQQLMQKWPGIVFSQRPDGSFYFVSPKIEELTGVPLADWQKQAGRFWQVIHEADLTMLQQQVKMGAVAREPITSTFRIRHVQSGKVSYILEHRQAVVTRGGLVLGYEGVWLDLTRQTLVEKRLNAASWKETLSSLTMGLAHDFRNIMAGILALTETFQSQLDKEHPFQQGLALMRANAWQGSQSIQRILQLYHGQSGEKNYQDLNELVQEMVEMSRRMLPRRILIETHVAPGRLPLYVDGFELRQAFLNLAVNARDAMPQGGRLVVETSRHESFPPLSFVRGTLPRLPAICFTMRDTGSGINPQHLPSIFDPFFTTKALDKGSGLGLYNVLLFTEKHQGAVSVESEMGKGTAFRLWLPEADFTEAEQSAQAAAQGPTLLLCGAPGQTLDSTAEFLRQHGLLLVTAASPEAARETLRSPNYRFAGVVLQTTAQSAALLADIKRENLSVKTILQVIGRNVDEVEAAFLAHSDLVLPAEVTGHEIVGKIRSLLTAPV
jgi:signal transduction histidine kinase